MNFKKNFIRFALVLVIFCSVTGFTFSKLIIQPSEIVNPHCLRVAEGKLFVLEKGTIFVYEINTGKLLKKFGKLGEGPGETRHFPNRGNMLRVFKGNVYIDGWHKIVQFSLAGKLIKESKKPWEHFVIEPVLNGWLTLHRSINSKTKKFGKMVTLNSLNLKRKNQYISDTSNLKDFSLFPDALNFTVSGEFFFIENSKKESKIDQYTSEGGHIRTIEHKTTPLPVRQDDIDYAYSEIAADPETRAIGGLKNFKKTTNVIIPKNFPSIKELTSSSKYLFSKTFNQKENKSEFYIYQIGGEYVGKVFLPVGTTDNFDDYLTGRLDRFYCFDNNHYYYFVENEDDDSWEIHRQDWKVQIGKN